MNAPSEKINKPRNFKRLLKLPKMINQWNLLFIDEHGKTVSFHYIRGLLAALIVLILIMAGTVGYLVYHHKNTVKENRALQNALSLSQEKVQALKAETNRLMVRLAETQSKLPKQSGKESSNPAAGKTESSADRPAAPTAAPKKPVQTEPPEKKGAPGVYDFLGYYDAISATLNARFTIKNVGGNGSRLSGYVFVIMKDDRNDPDAWVCLPSADLVLGKPIVIQDGRFFKIRRLINMEMASGKIIGPKGFNKATVLIFSESDRLIFEKTYRVKISVAGPTLEEKVPKFPAVPKQENGPSAETGDKETEINNTEVPDIEKQPAGP